MSSYLDLYFAFVTPEKTEVNEKSETPQKSTSVQGPVVQSVVSLMSSLVIKMLTVLVSTISNSQVFLLKKM